MGKKFKTKNLNIYLLVGSLFFSLLFSAFLLPPKKELNI
jgi:hypothetical protein